jgi:hypothetical protein
MQLPGLFRLGLVLAAAGALTAPVLAHPDHAGDARLLTHALTPLDVGSPEAAATLAVVFDRATTLQAELGQPLVLPGTVVDGARWDDGLLEVHLTLPADLGFWQLTDPDFGTFDMALRLLCLHDDGFRGARFLARLGPDGEYQSLPHYFNAPATPPVLARAAADPTPDPTATPEYLAAAWHNAAGNVTNSFGGPTASAARQPAGPLTGVTVFVSAGHGWTGGAGDGDPWFLQRPVLLGMTEDYGNIDQINYFAQYAFNAGATVVPLRPVGWQPEEVILDNDDPGVTFNGAWNNGDATKYYENGVTNSGVIYRWIAAGATETATAVYTPDLPTTGYWPVYAFALGGDNRTLQTYRVGHAGGVSAIAIDHRAVGNGWVWLGDYYFIAGEQAFVEITNQSPDAGAVIADAIRFGGGFGDVPSEATGTISGYPRDEEAQLYWAEEVYGNNTVGFDPSIYDRGFSDQSENVRAGALIAREMNIAPSAGEGGVLHERWRRIHLEFHSNASGGVARGQITLITDITPTTNQVSYAEILADEFDADMNVLSGEFEHAWVDRASPTFTSTYGAITQEANGNEFDATIIETAFHDNVQDAELLRDPRVRAAMARASVHGIIRFLNTLPGSQVTLDFAPDTPRYVHSRDDGNGNVIIGWEAPLFDGARGDAATGYVVYQSDNGFGFGDPIDVGNTLSYTVPDLAVGATRYFRVAAVNAGGESMPSEVIAARRTGPAPADILIVNGFDRLRRQNNVLQLFTQPAFYAGDIIERQVNRQSNAFDYAVEHAEALAANDEAFDYASNEAVMQSYVQLANYDIVVWFAGTEDTLDQSLSSNERIKLENFLAAGGDLFITGSNLAADLLGAGSGIAFAENTLNVNYLGDDAGTRLATGAAGSILDGVPLFEFGLGAGGRYAVNTPDRISARPNATPALQYSGGTGGTAGVQVEGATFNLVMFAFPFEAIGDSATRADIMDRVLAFLRLSIGPSPFDFDSDGDVDADDLPPFLFCFRGDGLVYPQGNFCRDFDSDGDGDVDLVSYAAMQRDATGPLD